MAKSFMDGAVKVVKQGKTRKLYVTLFPREGGRPYVVETEPDEEGTFQIEDRMSFKVSRGSVWEEGGKLRAIANEGNPQTLNAYNLTGDPSLDPIALHGMVSNNLWEQLDALRLRKSMWKQFSTWAFILIGVGLLLVGLWQTKTIGGGLEEVKEALESIQIPGPSEAAQSSAAAAGHQDIAPGGT